jgi:pantoate--beta-alanine ligase
MNPRIVRTPIELQDACDAARKRGERIGFVPTMGALHAGHLALVGEARRRAGTVVVSIFVNPTQFGPGEDFTRYPRDLGADVARLSAHDVAMVFAPEAAAMYPPGDETRVRVGAVAEPLCGPFRPGHFDGVATVVAKLFALVGACDAVFGRKDYQQLLVIRRMARDLFFPVDVVGAPIVRERDGLAMSSRNAYLSPADRAKAVALARGLRRAGLAFERGERHARALERLAREPVADVATSIDYVEVRDPDTLGAVPGAAGERALLAIACRIGSTRLIDNVVLGEDPVVA